MAPFRSSAPAQVRTCAHRNQRRRDAGLRGCSDTRKCITSLRRRQAACASSAATEYCINRQLRWAGYVGQDLAGTGGCRLTAAARLQGRSDARRCTTPNRRQGTSLCAHGRAFLARRPGVFVDERCCAARRPPTRGERWGGGGAHRLRSRRRGACLAVCMGAPLLWRRRLGPDRRAATQSQGLSVLCL